MTSEEAQKTMCPILSMMRTETPCRAERCQWWNDLSQETGIPAAGRCAWSSVANLGALLMRRLISDVEQFDTGRRKKEEARR